MLAVESIPRVLNDFPEIKVAILFGSAARDRLTPDSDVDIAVAGQGPLVLEMKAALVAHLSEALHHDVDLIDMQLVSGIILQQALCTGVILKSDDVVYPALLKKMWYNQSDMMPLTRMVLEKHCRRFVHG